MGRQKDRETEGRERKDCMWVGKKGGRGGSERARERGGGRQRETKKSVSAAALTMQ